MRIAGITTDSSTYIFPTILRGVKTTATAAGYSILLKATPKRIQLRSGDVTNSITLFWGGVFGVGQLQTPISALVCGWIQDKTGQQYTADLFYLVPKKEASTLLPRFTATAPVLPPGGPNIANGRQNKQIAEKGKKSDENATFMYKW